MKSRGGKFLLLLGALLAAMAFVVVYVVMSKPSDGTNVGDAASPTTPTFVSVAVVNRDLPAYTMLDSTNVATVDFESTTVPPNTTTTPASLYGKMTLVPLAKGQAVRNDQLTEAGFSSLLTKGERAFALAVQQKNTFGNALTENDYVDLVWTARFKILVQAPNEEGELKPSVDIYTSTKTLLQNMHVLRVLELRQPIPTGTGTENTQQATTSNTEATDASTAASLQTATANSPEMYLPDAPYQTVIILGVTDQQSEVIAFARDNGVIDLTLRSSAVQKNENGEVIKDDKDKEVRGDKDIETTKGITIDTLITEYGLPAPAVTAP